MEKEKMILYAITDRKLMTNELFYYKAEQALEGGITCLQLREKEMDEDEFLAEAKLVKSLCDRYDVPLIIDDNVRVAAGSGADGVHLGQNDMSVTAARHILGEKATIGVSAHNVKEALAAEAEGASYLGCGAAFVTSTKSDARPIATETIKAITEAVNIPVVAIGGINAENITRLAGTGIDGAAVVSAVFAGDNTKEKCRTLKKIIAEVIRK